ncbi:MAG: zinc chelation protein SecC [Myxococcales bacterium]|nr:zinc chelation protein SecC [Myxococcales bacterium]
MVAGICVPNPEVAHVVDLAAGICEGARPLLVQVEPRNDATLLDCFPVVDRQVQLHGGEVCCGWRIWERPSVLIEAEFHAVWQKPNGDLLDLTPNQLGAERILFLPDATRQYEGRQVNNVRRALRNDPEIHRFIQTCDAEFEFLNRGERALQHGAITLDTAEAAEWQQIQANKLMAEAALWQTHVPAQLSPQDLDDRRRERNRRKRERRARR